MELLSITGSSTLVHCKRNSVREDAAALSHKIVSVTERWNGTARHEACKSDWDQRVMHIQASIHSSKVTIKDVVLRDVYPND